jgi:hypothetical protein
MTDPGRYLLTHRAPPDLLERALQRHERSRAPQRRPAIALALAAAFLGGLVVGRGLLGAWAPGDQDAGAVADVTATTDVEADVDAIAETTPATVKLVLHAPEAEQVTVAGTWNGWDVASTPMQAVGDGNFVAMVTLPPGRHEYMFVLDGQEWRTDPTAMRYRDDGFGRRNALLEI